MLTDISMTGMTGIELTEHIKERSPDTSVILLSMHDDSAFVARAVQAEADGYLLKNTGKEELLAAIRKVMAGGTYFSQGVVRIIPRLPATFPTSGR